MASHQPKQGQENQVVRYYQNVYIKRVITPNNHSTRSSVLGNRLPWTSTAASLQISIETIQQEAGIILHVI